MRERTMEEAPWDGLGVGIVRTNFAIPGPKTVPRIEYERIFVLDQDAKLLGEYALRDDCPLEFDDLRRAIPVSGMRHLFTFYQGDYAFTPFRVEDLWLVVLTRGVPRIEERGSIGTLLAAMRLHLPPTLSPALAAREAALRDREREIDARESNLVRREQRVALIDSELQIETAKMKELEADLRARETRLNALRDYALEMQRVFRRPESKARLDGDRDDNPPPAELSVPARP